MAERRDTADGARGYGARPIASPGDQTQPTPPIQPPSTQPASGGEPLDLSLDAAQARASTAHFSHDVDTGNDAADDDLDPDYRRWRQDQMESMDSDYRRYRRESGSAFSESFVDWRKNNA